MVVLVRTRNKSDRAIRKLDVSGIM